MNSQGTYLGDGLYADFDGWILTLKTERDNAIHWVALEPEVFEALIQYAIKIGWLKKEITAAPELLDGGIGS